MSEEAFSHAIGAFAIEQLVPGKDDPVFDEAGVRKLSTRIVEAFPTAPDEVATALIEVMNFLALQGAQSASDVVMDFFLSLGALADQLGIDSRVVKDGMESLGARKKAASLIGGQDGAMRAPVEGEKRPEGSMRLADLMPPIKRR